MKHNRKQDLEAALSLSLLLLLFYLIWFSEEWLIVAAVCIMVLSLLSVPPLPWLLRQWMHLLHLIGVINTKILLGLIFFLVLTPIAFFYRLFNKPTSQENTNFTPRNHSFGPADFENPF